MYCALDIEKAGAKFEHKVLAVSFVVGYKSRFEIAKKITVCFPVPEEKDFEKRCLEEFWSPDEMQSILNRIRKEACKTEEEAVNKIDAFLNEIEEQWPDNEIEFISDNPSFDVGTVDYLLWIHKNRLPMRYTSKGRYRWVSDPSERLYALGKSKEVKDKISKTVVKHDHWPENDATFIYASMLEADKIMNEEHPHWCPIL